MSHKILLKDFIINLLLISIILIFIGFFKTIIYNNGNIYDSITIISKPIDKKFYHHISDNAELFDAISKRSLGKVCECKRELCEGGFYLVIRSEGARLPSGRSIVYSGVYTEYERLITDNRAAKRTVSSCSIISQGKSL